MSRYGRRLVGALLHDTVHIMEIPLKKIQVKK